ncbi:hypothetical protein GCK32_014799, partial [Trichostrongylus colubriformis]
DPLSSFFRNKTLPDSMRTGRAAIAVPGGQPRYLQATVASSRRVAASVAFTTCTKPSPTPSAIDPPSASIPRESADIVAMKAKILQLEGELKDKDELVESLKRRLTLKDQTLESKQRTIKCLQDTIALKDDQLNTRQMASDAVPSSKVQRAVERPTSPQAAGPAAKRARMNVDYTPHYSGSRSVAQRLKQCSLKDLNNVTSNGNLAFKTPSLLGCKPSPKLTSKQRNTVRIIAQYLRDLGLKESLDVLTEESGCKVENANARQLREAIYQGFILEMNFMTEVIVWSKCQWNNVSSTQIRLYSENIASYH